LDSRIVVRIAIVDPLGYTTPYDDRLAAALGRRGHDVHLLTSPFLLDRPPEPDGYVREEIFIPLSSKLLRRAPRARLRRLVKGVEYLPSVRRLVRRIDALDPDAVHIQWLARPELDIRWLRAIARRRPLVLTAHNAMPRRTRAYGAWREALDLAARVVVHSRQAVDRLAEFGIDRGKIVRIPHAVFDSPQAPAAKPPTGHTLLFFGLIRHYKGLDVLVSALPEIRRRVPDVRLVVAGDPLEPVEPVQELASSLGVDAAIEWRLEFVPDADVAQLVASAAAVVLPYREIESSGVLALAFGHGRPAVVSDLGAVGDAVREFGAGRAVPAEDARALADACADLLTDRVELRLAYDGALAARAALTWDEAARAHEAVYEELVGPAAGTLAP
jgi:glycosyltransferase involved in cell wall biosynthesis